MSVTRACTFAKSATIFVDLISSLSSSAYARFSKSSNRFFAANNCAFKSALVFGLVGLRVVAIVFPW